MTQPNKISAALANGVNRFREQNSVLEQVVTALGLIITPSYFLEGSLAKLFNFILYLANGTSVPIVTFGLLCFQTALVFYSLGLLVNFFLNYTVIKDGAPLKYDGVHKALEFTYIPRYLIAPEIPLPEDHSLLENEVASSIKTMDEIIAEAKPLPSQASSSEDIIEFYTSLFGEDEEEDSKKDTHTLADKIRAKGVDIEKLLKD